MKYITRPHYGLIVLAFAALGALLAFDMLWAAPAPVPVPLPQKRGGRTLLECQWARHSTRRFTTEDLPRGALARILWAADGVNRAAPKKRTAPSAFECYPVSLYVVERHRISRYDPAQSVLVPVRAAASGTEDFRVQVAGPSSFAKAPVVLVMVADNSRFPAKTPAAMRPLWAHAECGAIGQNVYLTCADLNLGTVFAAVMRPDAVRKALSLGEALTPCYMMPVGVENRTG